MLEISLIKNNIKKIKIELLKNSRKKNNFYYENIKKKLKLRRIERVTDFSKNSKNIICSKKTLDLINSFGKKNIHYLKINLTLNFQVEKGIYRILMVIFIGEIKIENIKMVGKNILLILLI